MRVNSPESWVSYAFCVGPAVHTGACPGDLGLVILFEKGYLPTYELDRSGNLWNGAKRNEAPKITSDVVTVFNLRFPQGVSLTLLNAKIYVPEVSTDMKKGTLSPLVIVIITLGSLMAMQVPVFIQNLTYKKLI
uniref:Neur_chan_LBD domain-containing protein n=1 Tax=Panagrellus redivivus TaxID=6233 RepID=A0A7E4V6P8_PANRE